MSKLQGRGGTLAHAYLHNQVAAIIIMRLTNERDEEKGRTIKSHSQGPRSGDIHFDDDEDWTLGSERGTDVIQVHTWQK